jgi:tetratricopeptide (TPR) repeat protein
MLYDPSNPVVQLCVKGIATEYSGNLEKAHGLYREAWELAKTDLEFLTAVHYLARVQPDPGETLKWNLLALEYARKTAHPDTRAFYPSLYLTIGKSYDTLGNFREAYDYYLLAHNSSVDLPDDGYGNMIRKGGLAGLERLKGQLLDPLAGTS